MIRKSILLLVLSIFTVPAYAAPAWGMETQIDLANCDPIMLRSADTLKKYAVEVAALLRVKRHGEPIVTHFGDAATSGYSLVQLIEKAHITAHCSNKTNAMYINIFCTRPYDPKLIAQFSQKFFQGSVKALNTHARA